LGVWVLGLGFGVWGIGPNPQPPIPNPQSPIPIYINILKLKKIYLIKSIINKNYLTNL
jgi:hypothetical protein